MRLKATLRRTGVWVAIGVASAAVIRVTKLGAWIHPSTAIHATAHFMAFACLTILLTLTIRRPERRLLFFVAIALLGLGTETYESLRNGAGIEGLDVLEDTLGAAVGLLAGETVAMLGMWMWQRHRIRAWESGESLGQRNGLAYALYKTHLQRHIPRRANARLDVSPTAHFTVYLSRVVAAGRAYQERRRAEKARRRSLQPGGTFGVAALQSHDQGSDAVWGPAAGDGAEPQGG